MKIEYLKKNVKDVKIDLDHLDITRREYIHLLNKQGHKLAFMKNARFQEKSF